jgi:hypothetical protein
VTCFLWSDHSLLRNNGKAAFSMGSVPVMTYNSRGNRRGRFLWGPFPSYITNGSNSCCRVSSQFGVTSEYSGRAAVFREELQSCRRTDPAILEDRQPVKKIQCEDSASVIVNCSEL